MAGTGRIAEASVGRTFGGSQGGYAVGPFEGVSMAQARKLHAAGALAGSEAAVSATKHPRQGRHMAGPVVLTIDLTDMRQLAKGYTGIATEIERGKVIISQSINHGLRKLKTRMTADLRTWTGLRVRSKSQEAIKLHYAHPGNLTGILRVRSGHTAVTKEYYGASWNRANPGATHAAWNRRQIAVGTFMAPGMKPVMRRTGSARLPIAPLWGPNMAREVDRHRDQVQAQVTAVGVIVSREAARLMSVAIAKAGR